MKQQPKKDLNALKNLWNRDIISDEVFWESVRRIKEESKTIYSSRITTTKPWLEGKGQPDFTNFIIPCYHLLENESPEIPNIEIYQWIANFLKSKNYTKKKGKLYSDNDIKRIIYFYETSGKTIRDFWNYLIDFKRKKSTPSK